MKWGSEDIIKCLKLYSEQMCLWDFNCPNFKNKMKRAAALELMVKELNIDGMTVNELKCKIHSIRNTYTNELRKIERSKMCGNGVDDVYKPRLPWFNLADSFLRKIVSKRKNHSHSHLEIDDFVETNMVEGNIFEERMCSSPTSSVGPASDSTTVTSHDYLTVEFPQNESHLKQRFKSEKNLERLKHLEDAIQALRAITSANKEDDVIDAFTKSVNAQMRKLPEEQALIAMSEIQSLLSAKRVEHLAELKRQSTASV